MLPTAGNDRRIVLAATASPARPGYRRPSSERNGEHRPKISTGIRSPLIAEFFPGYETPGVFQDASYSPLPLISIAAARSLQIQKWPCEI
jgi:hypothetical protein